MASSNKTYDILLQHGPCDGLFVATLARKLQCRGLRPWFGGCSAVAGASFSSQVTCALTAARMVASVIGPSGFPHLEAGDTGWAADRADLCKTIVVLMPGFRHSLAGVHSDLKDCSVVDMQKGLDDNAAWNRLTASIALLGLQSETTIDPERKLSLEALKRTNISSYDRIAEKFCSQWFEHPPVLAIEKFLRRLPRRAVVLDAGCGPGHHAKLIAKSGHEVIGVDLSHEMLRIARKSVHSVRFEKMDIQQLAFPQRTFDAVWCAAAALHIPREEIINLLRGYRRVLRLGGILGINLQVGRLSEVVEYGDDRRFFEYYRDSSEIATLLRFAGFSVEAWDYGETTRNTHDLDLKLRWATLYARYARPDEGKRAVYSGAGASLQH